MYVKRFDLPSNDILQIHTNVSIHSSESIKDILCRLKLWATFRPIPVSVSCCGKFVPVISQEA